MENIEIGKKIKSERENLNLTLKDIAEDIGVAISTIQRYENGLIKEIKLPVIQAIANSLNVNPNWLIGKENNKYIDNNQITSDEKDLLIKFNKLNNLGKNEAKKRVDELTQIEKYTIDNVSEELCITRTDIKNIQLYEIPASAGTGMPITDDLPYEIKQIDLTIAPQARKADFALYVRGDSMEPSYYDGDIIFIKSQPAVDNGQIGIFIYDDESYIKKYSVQEDGAYLVSLNKKYEPIKIDENLNFKVCGLVL